MDEDDNGQLNKNDFTNEFEEDIKTNNINHLFAISGLHVSFFRIKCYKGNKKLYFHKPFTTNSANSPHYIGFYHN